MVSSKKLPSEIKSNAEYDSFCYQEICQVYPISNEEDNILMDCIAPESISFLPKYDDYKETSFVEAKVILATNSPNSNDCTQSLMGLSKPMFTYCQVIKSHIEDESNLGITFETIDKNKMYISCIDPGSPFERPGCIFTGDQIIAIDGISTEHFSPCELLEMYKTSSSPNISITVMNASGDANTFMNSIEVPSGDCHLGLSLYNKSKYKGTLFVYDICNNGSLCSSLLGPGHQLLTINNIPCINLRAYDAATLLHNTTAASGTINGSLVSISQYKNILSRIPTRSKEHLTTVISRTPITTNQLESSNRCKNMYRMISHGLHKVTRCNKNSRGSSRRKHTSLSAMATIDNSI